MHAAWPRQNACESAYARRTSCMGATTSVSVKVQLAFSIEECVCEIGSREARAKQALALRTMCLTSLSPPRFRLAQLRGEHRVGCLWMEDTSHGQITNLSLPHTHSHTMCLSLLRVCACACACVFAHAYVTIHDDNDDDDDDDDGRRQLTMKTICAQRKRSSRVWWSLWHRPKAHLTHSDQESYYPN